MDLARPTTSRSFSSITVRFFIDLRLFFLPFVAADLVSIFPSGQYFDLDDQLRVNYAHFWLSLISPNSAEVQAERRKYAKLVGNVGADLYPILECGSLPFRSNVISAS